MVTGAKRIRFGTPLSKIVKQADKISISLANTLISKILSTPFPVEIWHAV
jgi:hypothetical protein